MQINESVYLGSEINKDVNIKC